MVLSVAGSFLSGRLSTHLAKARLKIYNVTHQILKDNYHDYFLIAKFPVYNFWYVMQYSGYKQSDGSVLPLNIKLKTSEIVNGKIILDALVDNSKKTISIYTFATGIKCYDKSWWANIYKRLRSEYQNDYNILEVLPLENISQIESEAVSYYSKDIREIAAVIANTELFLGADSGMMHLASASQTPTIGLFSVTNIEHISLMEMVVLLLI